ncbi:MAG: chemotaxis protein CheA [Deltaproteobacteria bacterium]|nr:chemotaxis protein CheA [Deltaproteobacteria bacterium]
MATEIDRLKDAIAKEANEIFEALDSLLLDLEKSPSDLEILNTIFRRVHTLKGSWGLYGHKALEHFTHAQEDLLDYLRSGELTVTTEIIDLLLECLDYTKLSYERVEAGEQVDSYDFAVLESKIKGFLPAAEAGAEAESGGVAIKDCGVDADFMANKAAIAKDKVKASVEIGLRLYQICIDFDKECMKSGVDPLRFFKGLGSDGELLAANVIWDEVPKLADLDPAHLYFGKVCALYASKLGVREVSALFDVAAGMGEVSFHQLTPAELTEHFGIEADPFWTEESGAASVEDEVKKKTINAFRTEIEKGIQAVRDNLIFFANEPSDRESLEKVYRFFHNICDTSSVLGLRDLESISSPLCMIMENVYVEGAALKVEDVGRLDAALDEIKSVLTSHVDKAITDFIDSRRKGADVRSFALAEALLDVGVVTREILEQTVSATASTASSGGVRVMERRQDARGGAAALRIDPVRLDNLVDMVGELVIAQSQVTQDLAIMGVSDTRLDRNIAQLTRITSGIQDMVMGMRMLPLEQTFKKLSRVARDVSKELGKEIDFTIFGEETEVDKTIIDEIGDPLMHLIRNCVDHGIEKPADRAAAWKDAKGKVELNAFHRGGNVVIEVKDDGKGISRERVAKKAIEKGLITTDAGLSDQQVISLIFEPGFSTAEEITSISGRGVGLDAVKRGVENLRGKVEVSTEFGKGSTFTIKLPLTLAIIEGMLVRVGEERYIIPTLSIETSFRPALNEITNVDSRGEVVKVRDAFHTLVKLHELYAIPGARKRPDEAILILVESEGRRCCIMVDDIIGNQHVVIKSLGDMLKGVKGVSGCTILGDGRVGLILDISGLMDITIG